MTDYNLLIAANADDGNANKSGGTGWSNSVDYVAMGNASGFPKWAYFRFAAVEIPNGVGVTSAVLRFRSYLSGPNVTFRTNIKIEDADDPTAPSSGADLIGRSLQSGIAWDGEQIWSADNAYDTDDFSGILEIHFSRSGWASGQALTIHIIDDSSSNNTHRDPKSRDYTSTLCAELRVTYDVGNKEIEKSESVAISESTNIAFEFLGELSQIENVAITENSGVELDKSLSEFEQVAIIENIGVELFAFFYAPQAVENVALIESVTVGFYPYFLEPQSGDDVALSEFVNAGLEDLGAGVVENITVTEFVGFPVYAETAEVLEIGDSITAFNWSTWFSANKYRAVPRYFLTLTGAADGTTDVIIPMSSFQSRKRTGNPTYLSAVVPGFDYAQQITDRSNGELVIEIGYEIEGTLEFIEEILRAALEEIRTDIGPTSRSISLSGNKTETFSTQIATLENSIYRSIQAGHLVHRFSAIDPFLNPGDTCRVGDDEFTVDYIIYMVNAFQTTMEVREG